MSPAPRPPRPAPVGHQVTVSGDAASELIRHLVSSYPAEGIGLLAGSWPALSITRIVPMRNSAAAGSGRAIVRRSDAEAAVGEVRSAGLDVVGCYHSHPDGAAVPSRTDFGRIRGDGVELIASVGRRGIGVVRAWLVGADRPPQPVDVVW